MIPKNAIYLNQLLEKPGSSVASSGHTVQKVTFSKKSGLNGLGFLKYCDDTYPPILAKYVVAISQLYRSSLGSRASEERLVYDSKDQIIGTVSIALKDFIPMQTTNESDLSDHEKNKLANPESRTLIDTNIAELLVASWRHKEDDLHPGNLSVAGRLDYDMSWYHLTSVIKGERVACGTLQDSPTIGTNLKEADLHTFPILASTRTHWPSQMPGNLNILKSYKAQKSFSNLKDSTVFKQQMFSSLLKELLSFQETTISSRLETYFDTEKFDLDSLASKSVSTDKKSTLLSLVNPQVFYEDDAHQIERLFADHFLQQAKSEYASFYKVVIGYGEFCDFLSKHPESYIEVKKFFEDENNTHLNEQNEKHQLEITQLQNKDLSDSERLKQQLQLKNIHLQEKKQLHNELHDLDEIDNTYQEIWRKCAVKKVIECLKQTILTNTASDQFYDITKAIDLSFFLTEDFSSKDLSNTTYLKEATDKKLINSNSPHLDKDKDIDPKIYKNDNDTEPKQIKSAIAELYSGLYNDCSQYFTKETATENNNSLFIEKCNSRLEIANKKVLDILNPGTSGEIKVLAQHEGCNKIISHWQTFLKNFSYKNHLSKRDQSQTAPIIKYVSTKKIIHPKPYQNNLSSSINNTLKNALSDWLLEQDFNKVVTLINKALQTYAPNTNSWVGWSWTRCRSPHVKKIIKKYQDEPEPTSLDLLLAIILEKGSGWERTSLNTIIIRLLINQMLNEYSTTFEKANKWPELVKFKNKISEPGFDFQKHINKIRELFTNSILTKQANSQDESTTQENSTTLTF